MNLKTTWSKFYNKIEDDYISLKVSYINYIKEAIAFCGHIAYLERNLEIGHDYVRKVLKKGSLESLKRIANKIHNNEIYKGF